jgi:hypothetical protein
MNVLIKDPDHPRWRGKVIPPISEQDIPTWSYGSVVRNPRKPRRDHTITNPYSTGHVRLLRWRGKADRCVWDCVAEKYEWANLTGNYLDIYDYAPMCQSCHRYFDSAQRSMGIKLMNRRGRVIESLPRYYGSR